MALTRNMYMNRQNRTMWEALEAYAKAAGSNLTTLVSHTLAETFEWECDKCGKVIWFEPKDSVQSKNVELRTWVATDKYNKASFVCPTDNNEHKPKVRTSTYD